MTTADNQHPPIHLWQPSGLRSLLKVASDLASDRLPSDDVSLYLAELYTNGHRKWETRAYYFLKPLIPRPIQLAIRRARAATMRIPDFPGWPIEPILVRKVQEYMRLTCNLAGGTFHRMSWWPGGSTASFVITHDIETAAGLRQARLLAETEHELGFVSSWNLVPERYPIDWNAVSDLRSLGCEIGVHGFSHDGKLFNSYRGFQRRAGRINLCARSWGAVGFRSEATLRNVKWLPELMFDYDSSYPDTDPYEPQPGGCCSIWPYFLGRLVELPITLPQDHTLFEILGHKDISLWKNKADWLLEQGGMVLIDVHPDYMASPERLSLYRKFLEFMKEKKFLWHALPRDVARWWRDRDASHIEHENGRYVIKGPAESRGTVTRTTLEKGGLCHEDLSRSAG